MKRLGGAGFVLASLAACLGCRTSSQRTDSGDHAPTVLRRMKLAGEGPASAGFDSKENLMVAGMYGPVQVWPFGSAGNYGESASTLIIDVRVESSQILDSGAVLVAQDDGVVRLWDWKTNQFSFTRGFPTPIHGAAASRDGRYVACGGLVFDRQGGRIAGKELPVVDEHALEFSPTGRYLLSGGFRDAHVVVRDLLTDELSSWQAPDGVTAAAMTADAQFVAAGLRNNEIVLWRRVGHEVVGRWRAPATVTVVRFSPDGKWLFAADEDGASRFDLQSMQPVSRVSPRSGRLLPMTMMAPYVAAGTATGDLLVMDLMEGRSIGRVHLFSDGLTTVAIAPNRHLIAATDPAGNIAVAAWK